MAERYEFVRLLGCHDAGDDRGREHRSFLRPDIVARDLGNDIVGLHFGSYALVVPPVAESFAGLVEKADGRFVSLDPNVRPSIEPDMDIWRQRVAHYAGHADLLKISVEDIEYLYPGSAPDHMVETWLQLGVQLVVITDGGDEVRAWTRTGYRCSMQPAACSIVDTVGAGDAFATVCILGLLRDWPVDLMMQRAQKFAAQLVGQRGATAEDRSSYLPLLESWQG